MFQTDPVLYWKCVSIGLSQLSLHYSNTAKAPKAHDEHDTAHFSCSDCWLTASVTLLFLQFLNLMAFCPLFLILLFHSMFYLSLILPAYLISAPPPPPPACGPPPDSTAATYPAGSGSAPGSCCPAVNCCSCRPGCCCTTTSQPAAAKPVPVPTAATTITQTGADRAVCPTTAGPITINPAHSPGKRPSTTNLLQSTFWPFYDALVCFCRTSSSFCSSNSWSWCQVTLCRHLPSFSCLNQHKHSHHSRVRQSEWVTHFLRKHYLFFWMFVCWCHFPRFALNTKSNTATSAKPKQNTDHAASSRISGTGCKRAFTAFTT